MRVSEFKLYLNTESGVKSYSDYKNNLFTFSISEKKENDVTVIKGSLKANSNIRLHWLDVMLPCQLEGLSYYANGFQSWSAGPLINKDTKIKKLSSIPGSLFRLKNFGDYNFNKPCGGLDRTYSHLYMDLLKQGKTQMFLGDLFPYKSYTTFAADYKENIITAGNDLEGIFIEEGSSEDIFSICIVPDAISWFQILNIERLPCEFLTGWTSWYNYYTKITEFILEANMKNLSEADIPIDVFQIDDGYFTAVGDWLLPNDRFPMGMKAVADEIKEYGWTAGLWSAPFVTDSKSTIFKEKSNWILRTPKGKLQIAGWNPNWTGVFYALDIYNKEFREYLKEVYETTVNEWGYKFLKLDFLYAAGLQPREGKTRCMVMTDAMDLLLEITNGAKILACGAPIGPAAGKCHYCRIGGDISHGWEDSLLKSINYRERVSTAASIGNTISRFFLNEKLFLNDPDVFILRDTKEIKLNEQQKDTLFENNMSKSGLVFFSDDVSLYSNEQVEKVKQAFLSYKKKSKSIDF